MSLLVRRRGMMGAKTEPKLPNEYQQVEWIANTNGEAYVTVTQGSIADDVCTIVDVIIPSQPSGNHGRAIVGSRSDRDNLFYIAASVTRNEVYVAGKDGPNVSLALSDLYGVKTRIMVRVVRSQSKVYLTASNISDTQNASDDGSYTANGTTLFRNPRLNITEYRGKICYYETKNETTGSLITSCVPCYRKSDGVIGMYDMVSGTFKVNEGTGTFEKGPDVT